MHVYNVYINRGFTCGFWILLCIGLINVLDRKAVLQAKKRAFTIAEVLIVLSIIGVIVAITIPSLVERYQKHVTIVQLKKVFADFAKAASMAQIVHGDFDAWDYSLSSSAFFNTYFSSYIVLSKKTVGNAKEENIQYYQTSGDIENGLLQMRDKSEIMQTMSGYQIFATSQSLGLSSTKPRRCFVVDINGYKKPNTFGRDLFVLCMDSLKGIVPSYLNDDEDPLTAKMRTREQLLKGPSAYKYHCNKKARGMWCAAVILLDGWQIKNDYPW